MLKHVDICKRNTSIRLQGTRKIFSKNTNKMHEALLKTIITGRPWSFDFTYTNKKLKEGKITWIDRKINRRSTININKWFPRCESIKYHYRCDNATLNEKGCEVNLHLQEICTERKLSLIDHSKKMKPINYYRDKRQLNQKTVGSCWCFFETNIKRFWLTERNFKFIWQRMQVKAFT